MEAQRGKIVRFGVYEVDLASGELRKHGTLLRLQEQPFQVLSALIGQPGEVVSREDLIRRLWPDGTAVEFDHGLNAAVTRLRHVLSDSAESPRYVETVARRGYRFIAPIEATSDVVPAIASEPVAAPPIPTNKRWQVAVLLSLLAIAASAWWWNSSRRQPVAATATQLKAVPLTSEPGNSRNVTFSPDGSQIAYQWAEKVGAPAHVYIRQVGLGDPIRLTKDAVGEYGPAWSRDGRYIAFLRRIDENELSLIVAPVLGGVERKIAGLPAPPMRNPIGFARRVDWTADGQSLIVAAPPEPGGLECLWEIRLDTGERRPLLPPVKTFAEGVDHDPAVSPDGRTLAFVRATSLYKRNIFLMSMPVGSQPAGKPFQLTFQKSLALNPAWTRDGKEIIFVSDSALWRIEARAGGAKAAEIQSLAGGGYLLPTVGPGGRLAFTRRFNDTNVWRQELAPSGASAGPPALLISATSYENSADYSPDGSRIALQSNRSGITEVWICANTGNRCVQVTSLNAHTGSPRWSPDGKQIAFDSDADGHFEVYTMDAAGGSVRRLTNHVSENSAPSWSRDGMWLYFMSSRSGTGEVWKLPTKGGAEVQLTRHGGWMAIEAPDGKSLYYSSGDANSKLYRSATDGSGETKVLDSLFGRSFAVTSDHVFYLRREENGEHTLRSFAIATKVDARIATILKPTINGLSLSPDGKYLIYTKVDSQGSDLMLVENFR